MTVSTDDLFRWSGLAAMVGGVIFAGIQPIHPPDFLSSVTTPQWTLIITLKYAMCFLLLIGIAGLYLRQVEEGGWLALTGFILFSAFWALQVGYVFADLFILPPLATAAPQFVDSFLGTVNGSPGTMDIGALVPFYAVGGLLYLAGGLVFGIATIRAKVLPRWPATLMAVTAVVTPAAVLLPHAIQRLAAIPMGIAIAWLGYALWSARRPWLA
jgi:hypothetical protein